MTPVAADSSADYSASAWVRRLSVDEALSQIGKRFPAVAQQRHAMDEHIAGNASGGSAMAAGPPARCCSRSICDDRR